MPKGRTLHRARARLGDHLRAMGAGRRHTALRRRRPRHRPHAARRLASSTSAAFDAGVLCLDVHVALGFVAVGVMDGTVAIYDASLNEVRRFRASTAIRARRLVWRCRSSPRRPTTIPVRLFGGQGRRRRRGGRLRPVRWRRRGGGVAPKTAHARRGGARRPPPAHRRLLRREAHGIEPRAHAAQPQRQRRLDRQLHGARARASVDGKWLALATDAGNALVLDAGTGEQCTPSAWAHCRTRCSRGGARLHPSSKYLYASSQQPGQEGLLQVWKLARSRRSPSSAGTRRACATSRCTRTTRRGSSAPASTRRSGCGGAARREHALRTYP